MSYEKKEVIDTPDTSYTVSYNGYTILGSLQIPKIGVNTVILKEQTYYAMNIGAIKTYGVDLNEIGGTVVSGHNFRNNTAFFYNIKNLVYGDVITVTDDKGRTINYKVYEVSRYVSPTDVSYLNKTNDYTLILVTCESGGKSRIVVKANYTD